MKYQNGEEQNTGKGWKAEVHHQLSQNMGRQKTPQGHQTVSTWAGLSRAGATDTFNSPNGAKDRGTF